MVFANGIRGFSLQQGVGLSGKYTLHVAKLSFRSAACVTRQLDEAQDLAETAFCIGITLRSLVPRKSPGCRGQCAHLPLGCEAQVTPGAQDRAWRKDYEPVSGTDSPCPAPPQPIWPAPPPLLSSLRKDGSLEI